MPVDVNLIKSKIARLKPEQRLSLGLAGPSDSVKLGLKARPTAKSEALNRLVDRGMLTEAGRDSSLAGLSREKITPKEAALGRMTSSGQVTPQYADSLRVGLRRPDPEKPLKASEILREKQAASELRVLSGKGTAQDSAFAVGLKRPKEEKPRSVGQAGVEYAKEIADATELMNKPAGAGSAELMFTYGDPARNILESKAKTYGDSSAIVGRALEKGFDPANNMNELIQTIPVAAKALSEYSAMRKQGQSAQQAEAALKSKYGYGLKDLRDIHYVATGQ